MSEKTNGSRVLIAVFASLLLLAGIIITSIAVVIGTTNWMMDRMMNRMEEATEIRVVPSEEAERRRATIGTYKLAAHGQQRLSVIADGPTRIGFTVIGPVSDEHAPVPLQPSATLRTADDSQRISASLGGSSPFWDTNGEINLVLESLLDFPIEIKVYEE